MLRRNLNKLTLGGRERNRQADHDYANSLERPLKSLITDDKEILGESKELHHFLRDRYRRKTDKVMKKFEAATDRADKLGNRERWKTYRDHRTDIKIARLESRMKSTPDSFLGKQIKRQQRQKLSNLRYKKKVISHDLKGLERKRLQKPEELQKKIDGYVKKKVDAMYKKTLRKESWKKHGFNHVKRTEFVASLKPKDKRRIVREAILLVRKKNIEAGRLSMNYSVDNVANEDNVAIREVEENYGRIVE